ncbi:SMP-30/gluconolactonase/LRE family protein, partial [Candidatus Latescibacterota bacterium]
GFTFLEGPVADEKGNVYFIDIPPDRIHIWSTDGVLSTFKEVDGGANGLCFDKNGNLLVCAWLGHKLLSIDPKGEVTTLADNYEGIPLNAPNDVWIDSNDGIYFTDAYNEKGPVGRYVFYIPPGNGKLVLMEEVDYKPNGVAGSPDGSSVYVVKYHSEETYVFDVADDGMLLNKRFFAPSGDDGLTIDSLGNVYLANKEKRSCIDVYDPGGKLIETIEVPEPPSNLCFGGKDNMTIYITGITEFYSLKMSVKGL